MTKHAKRNGKHKIYRVYIRYAFGSNVDDTESKRLDSKAKKKRNNNKSRIFKFIKKMQIHHMPQRINNK